MKRYSKFIPIISLFGCLFLFSSSASAYMGKKKIIEAGIAKRTGGNRKVAVDALIVQ